MAVHDLVVVGAGPAGTGVAYHLRDSGLDVLVLEAGSAVGGRTRSVQLPGGAANTGALFVYRDGARYAVQPAPLSDEQIDAIPEGGPPVDRVDLIFAPPTPDAAAPSTAPAAAPDAPVAPSVAPVAPTAPAAAKTDPVAPAAPAATSVIPSRGGTTARSLPTPVATATAATGVSNTPVRATR